MLYSDDLILQKTKEGSKLNYKLDIPPSYEYYKNKTKPQNEYNNFSSNEQPTST